MRSGVKLLVVEDDAEMNLMLRDFLKNQGYAVTMSSSAAGALKFLSTLAPEERPRLVLSDIKLGSQSGIDLCRQVGTVYPKLPVILFSVNDHFEKEALESGAKRFLKKPFALDTLAKVVTEELKPK